MQAVKLTNRGKRIESVSVTENQVLFQILKAGIIVAFVFLLCCSSCGAFDGKMRHRDLPLCAGYPRMPFFCLRVYIHMYIWRTCIEISILNLAEFEDAHLYMSF